MSHFSEVKPVPPIAVFERSQLYSKDTDPRKVDLVVGAYRDNQSSPWVLPVVRKSIITIANDEALKFEYLQPSGLPELTKAATRLLLGDGHPAIEENRCISFQTLSGTGALSLAANFLIRVVGHKTVFFSKPTWGNHLDLFAHAGCQDLRYYRYWDSDKLTVNFNAMTEDLKAAPNNSVVVFHACAHNPTGMDPSEEQWKILADICEERSLFPLFDCAYQGFASGDIDEDIKSFRYFVSRGFETICCQSFAKNFGLYNHRVGNMLVVVNDPKVVEPIRLNLALLVRKMYSNPPATGARIVSRILNDPKLTDEWKQSIREMSSRLTLMRKALRDHLEQLKTPGSWNHITDQIGMFSYTGLNAKQVKFLMDKFHVYLLDDGRISMAGLNTENIRHVAEAINKAVLDVA